MKVGEVRVVEQMVEKNGAVMRSVVLFNEKGERIGGVSFASSDSLYDFPTWVEKSAARLTALEAALRNLLYAVVPTAKSSCPCGQHESDKAHVTEWLSRAREALT